MDDVTINKLYARNRNIGIYYSKWAIHYCKYNDFEIFKKLIQYFKQNLLNFNIVDILNINANTNKINVAFRSDIDCDIVTAIKMSNYFKEQKTLNTFYVLHTSNYYRQNDNYPLLRCDDLKQNILKIQNDYCSIGLHLDPIHTYIKFGGDGSKEVTEEIYWLRNFVSINSVSAHNSYYVHGAENFEIFENLSYENRKHFKYRDKIIPLSTLNLKKLNLQEINYPKIKKNSNIELMNDTWNRNKIFKKAVFDNEIFKHGYNINIWCVGMNEWIISNQKERYFNLTDFNNVIKYLNTLKTKNKRDTIVFNLHPIYFSQ